MYELIVIPKHIATTPRHLGTNVEVQIEHDKINLWDWLADSGATIAREFHPEQSLRKEPVDESVWEDIKTPADFDEFRKRVCADPEGGPIQWQAYHFDKSVEWMGVPDGIVKKVKEAGVEPLVSMGYNPKLFSRAPLTRWDIEGTPADDDIDWAAAASAYDYYFAMIYRYASKNGARYFLLHNEPECCSPEFHFPKELDGDWETPCYSPDPDIRRRGIDAVCLQWAVMARVARAAMDDVKGLLGDKGKDLFLSGPASGAWEWFWQRGGQYVDSVDFHHYHPDPEAMERVYRRVAFRAGGAGQKISSSEYNVKCGNVPFTEMPFVMDASLKLARLLLHSLRLSKPGDPLCEFLTEYLFHFPATHRNFKSLLYGDMNLLDWTVQDQGLNSRTDDWYPTWQEMQIRFAAPCYHLFRMLARCVPGMDKPQGYKVLETGEHCLIDDAHLNGYVKVEQFVVDTGDAVIITLLNRFGGPLPVDVEITQLGARFKTMVVRETSAHRADQVIDERPADFERIIHTLAPSSLTQFILTPLDLASVESIRLEEHTITPGTLDGLDVYQTTRLRAIATLGGKEIDVTGLNAVWTSSAQPAVPVYQGGLVQRLRPTKGAVTITASTASGAKAEAVVEK